MIDRTPAGYVVGCDYCEHEKQYWVSSPADLMGAMSEDGWQWVSGARVSVPGGWQKCATCVKAPPPWKREPVATEGR